jgi:uncharacterized protein
MNLLVSMTNVDPRRICVIGSSYGGYLAAILAKKRTVRWLGLRAPALYLDEDWTKPKLSIDRTRLMEYRLQSIKPMEIVITMTLSYTQNLEDYHLWLALPVA